MDDELKTIEESFDNIPEEVKHYIYGKDFVASLDKLCSDEGLTKNETVQLRGALYGYLAQVQTEEVLVKTIQSISKSIESNQRIIDWIKKEVTDKVLSMVVTAYVDDEEDEEESIDSEKDTQDKQYSLGGIQDRLTKPSVVAPITRDYSVTRATEVSPKTESTPRAPSMDIYREIPEV